MATKSEYYRFNGTSWELHYFKTSADLLVETATYKVLTATERTKISDYLTTFNQPGKLLQLNLSGKVEKTQIEDLSDTYLPLAGGTVTGHVNFNANLVAPDIYALDIHSDSGSVNFKALDMVTFGGALLRNVANPVADDDVATKGYVDSNIVSLSQVNSFTANQNFNGGAYVGGPNFYVETDYITFFATASGEIDFDGNRLVMVGDAVNSNEAVTKGQLDNHSIDADKVNSLFETVTTTQYTRNLTKNKTYYVNTTSNVTFYIDSETEGGNWQPGDQITVIKGSTGYVRFAQSGAVIVRNIDGTPGSGTCYIGGQYEGVTLMKLATNAWVIIGSLSSTAVY